MKASLFLFLGLTAVLAFNGICTADSAGPDDCVDSFTQYGGTAACVSGGIGSIYSGYYQSNCCVTCGCEGMTQTECAEFLTFPSVTVTVDDLGINPEYNGIAITGTVSMTFPDKKAGISPNVQITYMLESGLDGQCNVRGPAVRSCVIAIYTGRSCTTIADIGDHFYTEETDPWMFANYVTSKTLNVVTAVGGFDVTNGHSYLETMGRVLVVHNYNGDIVTCAIIGETPVVSSVSSLGTYPISLAIPITGTAQITSYANWTVGIQYDFDESSLSEACLTNNIPVDTRQTPTGQTPCGISIHRGMSCENPDSPGPNFFNGPWNDSRPMFGKSVDPWATAATSYAGGSSGWVFANVFASGLETLGRTLIVNDEYGDRVSCTVFWPSEPVTAAIYELGHYPEYAGSEEITGEAVLTFFPNEVVMIEYNFQASTNECENGAGDAANSCGIHIHEGYGCDWTTQPGGHYYNTDFYTFTVGYGFPPGVATEDPWTNIGYTTDPDTNLANGVVAVMNFASYSQTAGRVLVVHDYSGARVTCVKIEQKCPVSNECCYADSPYCVDYIDCVNAFDPWCGDKGWDEQCVKEAQERCGMKC